MWIGHPAPLITQVIRHFAAERSKGDDHPGATAAKVKDWLTEYKKAVAVLDTFGLKVGKFSVGMGALPEVHTSLVGSIENIREERLRAMIEEHKSEDLLVSLLRTLIWARWGWEQMELKLTGVTLHVTLGVPPKLSAEIH